MSGNVSLYNETNGAAIPPTPTVGAVGLLADYDLRAGFASAVEGDTLVLIGATKGELGASIYLREVQGREDGAPPPVDLALERKTGDLIRELIVSGAVGAVHDLSDGGLLIAAADMALASQVGIVLDIPPADAHGFLFGEDQARYLISSPNADDILRAAAAAGVPAAVVGKAEGEALAAQGLFSIPLAQLRVANEAWLPSFMDAA